MKLIVTGSRDLDDPNFVAAKIDEYLRFKSGDVELINFVCKGGTNTAAKYAKDHGLKIISMQADWTKYPKDAAKIRNAVAAKLADELLVIQYMDEHETKELIQNMKDMHKPTWVVNVPRKDNNNAGPRKYRCVRR